MGLNLEGQLAEGHLSREQDGKLHFTGPIPVDFLKDGGEVVMIPKSVYEELTRNCPISFTRNQTKMCPESARFFPGVIEVQGKNSGELTKLYLNPSFIQPLKGEELIIIAYEGINHINKEFS